LVNNSILQERMLVKHLNNPKQRTPKEKRSVTEDLGEVEEDTDHSVEEVDPSEVEEEVACMDHVAASAEAWAAVDS